MFAYLSVDVLKMNLILLSFSGTRKSIITSLQNCVRVSGVCIVVVGGVWC